MYPTLSEYLASIKDSTENFDKLTHLKPVLDNHGDPSRSVGGFAVVFKMQDEDTGKLYAIKCFHELEEKGFIERQNNSKFSKQTSKWKFSSKWAETSTDMA